MYARIVGRSGAAGAKVGGVGVVVPATFGVTGKIRVDFKEKSIAIVDASQQFKTMSG